ncbi:2OG-Fe(II) oxygenase [Nocardia sp. NPDC050710]|uniref:2OG-Fe(II)-dependent halogenase WelO5 family protein n=1 Tax=Nocardia sp. NPDC050710 TaxID=3157220 RepID=UPI0033E31CF2
MGNACDHDPYFTAVTASEFQRRHIADLASGRCAAVRVPDFISAGACAEILGALLGAPFDAYGTARVYPPVLRFGVGVSDHRREGVVADSYWAAVDSGRQAWRDLGLSFDPFLLCREGIGREWPNKVEIGRRGGREMGAGVAREPNQGFQVHFDDALREFTGNLLDANLVAQFAFNLYLSVPEQGGETVVWRHRWSPADELYRLPGSYGYRSDVVDAAESFALRPRVGEALLFDPRNYHAVLPSQGARRIALGFAVGLSDNGELLTWG